MFVFVELSSSILSKVEGGGVKGRTFIFDTFNGRRGEGHGKNLVVNINL